MGVLMMKVSELMNILRTNNKKLIPDSVTIKYPDVLSDYINNSAKYDLMFDVKYGDLNLISKFNVDNAIDLNSTLIEILFVDNAYKYDKLFKTLSLEYNPIDNYNRDESVEITNDEITHTTIYGASKTTNIYGNSVSNNELLKSAYNDNDYSKDSKTVLTENERTDTSTNDSKTDTTTDSPHKITTHSVIKGNIGVTTSQQMIESERSLAYFVFYDIIFNDIINRISTGVWCYD